MLLKSRGSPYAKLLLKTVVKTMILHNANYQYTTNFLIFIAIRDRSVYNWNRKFIGGVFMKIMEKFEVNKGFEIEEKFDFNSLVSELDDVQIEDIMFGRNQPSQHKCKTVS